MEKKAGNAEQEVAALSRRLLLLEENATRLKSFTLGLWIWKNWCVPFENLEINVNLLLQSWGWFLKIVFPSAFRPTPAWKPVSMPTSALETGFQAGIDRNTDGKPLKTHLWAFRVAAFLQCCCKKVASRLIGDSLSSPSHIKANQFHDKTNLFLGQAYWYDLPPTCQKCQKKDFSLYNNFLKTSILKCPALNILTIGAQ